MKLLKLLSRVLPHSLFVALLSSRFCRGIRIRLVSRSLVYQEFSFICRRLRSATRDSLGVALTLNEINSVFRMSRSEAISKYGATNFFPFLGWWSYGDPNREKYHNFLLLKQ